MANPIEFYTGGIVNLTEQECKPTSINHAVAIVGYGIEDNPEFWIVKNEWGIQWGEKGYFRMALGSGVCGINTYVTSGHIE